MNAYELAAGGEHIAQANHDLDSQIRGYIMDMAVMLHQQEYLLQQHEKHNLELQEIIKVQKERIVELEKEVKSVTEQGENFWQQLCELQAQTNAEPVAYIDHVSGKPKLIGGYVVSTPYDIPLYTTPQTKQIWCDCGDSIEPDSGAICGNCLAAMKIGKE